MRPHHNRLRHAVKIAGRYRARVDAAGPQPWGAVLALALIGPLVRFRRAPVRRAPTASCSIEAGAFWMGSDIRASRTRSPCTACSSVISGLDATSDQSEVAHSSMPAGLPDPRSDSSIRTIRRAIPKFPRPAGADSSPIPVRRSTRGRVLLVRCPRLLPLARRRLPHLRPSGKGARGLGRRA